MRDGTRTSQPCECHADGHPVRGRFNAWFFDTLDGAIDRLFRDRKRRLLAGLSEPIVEIGPGVGANFRYYGRGARVIAIEPNPFMHARLRANAARAGIELTLRGIAGERLDLPDASVPTVVGTLVLCTVSDPERVVAEVRRVLQPGGRFVFIEHVVAPPRSALRRIQRAVERPWGWIFEGCRLDRDTAGVIERAGFREVRIERYVARSVFVPVNSQIAGTAWR